MIALQRLKGVLRRLWDRFTKPEAQRLLEAFSERRGLFLVGNTAPGQNADPFKVGPLKDGTPPWYRVELCGLTNLTAVEPNTLAAGSGESAEAAYEDLLDDTLRAFGFSCVDELKIWLSLNAAE